MSQTRSAHTIPRLLVLLVVLALFFALLLGRTAIADWVRLYGYSPSVEIASLANRTSMTEEGRHLFYINRPALVSRAEFTEKCPTSEKTIVLGCYHGVQNGIYVLTLVDDERLDGVMDVTAAHEMLHAAYDRLSGDEKKDVSTLLSEYYKAHSGDTRIKEALEVYASLDTDGINNEMHSIIGTEVSDLPLPLEDHYRKYFTDRKRVVSLANGYRSEFTQREDAVATIDERLSALKQEIAANRDALTAQRNAIEAQAEELNRLRGTDAAAYNARVDTFNAQVRRYNALIENTEARIVEYNQLVEERNKIAFDYQQLTRELSGKTAQPIR